MSESTALKIAREAAQLGPNHERFAARGFTKETIDALIEAGIDYPERLLFMEEGATKRIPNLDQRRVGQVNAYVSMFRENR